MYSFAFCLFIEERKKKEQTNKRNRKINTSKKEKKNEQKNNKKKKKKKKKKQTEELHRPGIEPGTSRSTVLHTALMHTLRNNYRKSLLKQW